MAGAIPFDERSLGGRERGVEIGRGTTYPCPAGGSLYLGINDTDLDGHSGEFQADVTLDSQ